MAALPYFSQNSTKKKILTLMEKKKVIKYLQETKKRVRETAKTVGIGKSYIKFNFNTTSTELGKHFVSSSDTRIDEIILK